MTDHGYLEVVNWTELQHYKDRDPPWIKLYRRLQDNYEWLRLQDASKAHLVGIWILASKNANRVPADPVYIAQRIGATDPVNIEVLIAAGFISRLRRASDTPAERQQVATPETEVETETEAKTEQPSGVSLTVVGRSVPARNLEAIQARLAGVLAGVQADSRRRVGVEEMRRVKAELVFAYWASKLDHPKALLDAERERRLVKRLEENGGDVNELLYVVDGALKDDWTMGRSARNTKKFDGIETIYQDRAHVEKFAGLCTAYKQGIPHPMAVKYLESAQEGVA